MPFEKWDNGEDLYEQIDKDEGILDRDVRRWAEECDQMQGFQVFTGADDAWGGFASRYVESLRDEYGKTSIWLWGLEESAGNGSRVGSWRDLLPVHQLIKAQTQQLLRATNVSRTLVETNDQASLYLPVALPPRDLPQYITIDRDSAWHAGALLSTAVETATLPSRLRDIRPRVGYMHDIEASLNANGNQHIAECQCSVIDPRAWEPNGTALTGAALDTRMSGTEEEPDEEDSHEVASDLDMTFLSASGPSHDPRRSKEHVFARVDNLRGYLDEVDPLDDEDVSEARKRRRLASLPIHEKWVSSFLHLHITSQMQGCNNAGRYKC